MQIIDDDIRIGLHVTDILQQCGFRNEFDKIPEEMRNFYMRRGKYVHKATELWDGGTLNEITLSPIIAPYLSGYKKFREDIGGTVHDMELTVVSPVWGYCGRLDRIFHNTKLCKGLLIVDIKTSAADEATRLQTSGYAVAWKEARRKDSKIRRGYVSLQKTGTYRCEMYDRDDVDEVGWLNCVRKVRADTDEDKERAEHGINCWRLRNGMPLAQFTI